MIRHHGQMRCVLLFILALILLGAGSANAQVCVEGTVTAEYQSSGPFGGMWLYTMEISWTTGSGTFSFYSLLGPGPAGPPSGDNLWVKFGQLTCSGLLTGELPICDGCATPVEQTTWGAIKSTF